jgi:hypothetical protein
LRGKIWLKLSAMNAKSIPWGMVLWPPLVALQKAGVSPSARIESAKRNLKLRRGPNMPAA